MLAVVVLYFVGVEGVDLPCSLSGTANQDEDLPGTTMEGSPLVEDHQEGTHNQKWVDNRREWNLERTL